MSHPPIQRYDINQSWEWNLRNAPVDESPFDTDTELSPGNWSWCGVPVSSPLGIPAGPLLNGHWILHYARLGFDLLTYKTVRSTARDCYPQPNLVHVRADAQLTEPGHELTEARTATPTWAVSFGMPSVPPADWRNDVAFTRSRLPRGKVLVVSVVGSETAAGGSSADALDQLANDFGDCAAWAVEAGADGVEANFSCPNVTSPDGSLFQQPEDAAFVAGRIRERIDQAPLVLKIGRVTSGDHVARLIESLAPFADGIAMTNSISATVKSEANEPRFGGAPRGICGDAIRAASLKQVETFRTHIDRMRAHLEITGVGGISTCEHVRQFLNAGANSVGLATAAMLDPDVGRNIRSQWWE